MSDSRLEKFIYAICSMDVSDLPVPLSRIEKLWNCLITEEAPDFEPLSRNEKYLMAMLDRYDISNLPAPMSRGEKLLYKIAVGETDLSDVPGYLSRYEELLKYLIENGGVLEKEVFNAISKNGDILVTKNGDNLIYNGRNSGSDSEYVLYTLNQSLSTLYTTAEKPVKSAILKGSTLVNHKKDNVVISPELSNCYDYTLSGCKSNTNYLIKFSAEHDEDVMVGFLIDTSTWSTTEIKWAKPGNITVIINSGSTPNYLRIRAKSCENLMIIEYQEGMENMDIPYFEGMQSVKMPVLTTTGKNIVGNLEEGSISANGENVNNANDSLYTRTGFIPLKKDTAYTFSLNGTKKSFHLYLYDLNKNFKEKIGMRNEYTPEVNCYIRLFQMDNINNALYQVEEGTIATPYEPYQSSILTVNEDVTLRGIGDVKDELNVMTGEVVERIGEVVFDGSENWILHGNKTNTNVFRLPYSKLAHVENHILCDKLPIAAPGDVEKIASSEDAGSSGYQTFYVALLKTKANTLSDFKSYLSENPLTVQYELKTPTTKTVDLTVVDQDNQPTQLGTFENITHVSLEAENLIPEVELEVAARISEELASASPLMDDISTKQERLETTVDEQSENVDATMIATTEIYEEIL